MPDSSMRRREAAPEVARALCAPINQRKERLWVAVSTDGRTLNPAAVASAIHSVQSQIRTYLYLTWTISCGGLLAFVLTYRSYDPAERNLIHAPVLAALIIPTVLLIAAELGLGVNARRNRPVVADLPHPLVLDWLIDDMSSDFASERPWNWCAMAADIIWRDYAKDESLSNLSEIRRSKLRAYAKSVNRVQKFASRERLDMAAWIQSRLGGA